jgi:thioredoxin 1
MMSSRATTEDEWGRPVTLRSISSSYYEDHPDISPDGLSLYFCSQRLGGYGDSDLWVARRETKDSEWSEPVNLGASINSAHNDTAPCILADGLTLFFDSDRPDGQGSWDIWVSTRQTTNDNWGVPETLSSIVNGPFVDGDPSISSDGRMLFFTSDRPGGRGDYDVWLTMRKTTEDEWETPVNLGSRVNWIFEDMCPDISADGTTLYFTAGEPVGFLDLYEFDLWQVTIEPIVDLNDDGLIDSEDMCIIVDHWGEDYPLCDIGPMPWGDRVVDVQDLIVFIDYWEEARSLNLIQLKEANFDQIVLGSDVPVLVDFWAPWCGPCLEMAPIIEEIADEYVERIKVCKLNIDYSPDISKRYEITAIPTMMLFKDGQIVKQWIGITAKNELTAAIDELI